MLHGLQGGGGVVQRCGALGGAPSSLLGGSARGREPLTATTRRCSVDERVLKHHCLPKCLRSQRPSVSSQERHYREHFFRMFSATEGRLLGSRCSAVAARAMSCRVSCGVLCGHMWCRVGVTTTPPTTHVHHPSNTCSPPLQQDMFTTPEITHFYHPHTQVCVGALHTQTPTHHEAKKGKRPP